MNIFTCFYRRVAPTPIFSPSYIWMVFFLFTGYSLKAQNKQIYVQKNDPAWVEPYNYKAAAPQDNSNIDGGEYLVLFDQQYNLNTEAFYYKIVRQITSEAGVQSSSQISVTFSPSYQKLIFHSVRVLRGDHVIDQLDLSRIKLIRNESDLDRYIYSGLYTAYLNLDDIRLGDQIEYSYTLAGMNPVLDHHFGDMLYFNSQTPISHLLIRMIAAKGQPLYLKYFNKAQKPVRSVWDGKTVYEWKMDHCPPYLSESDEPSWYYGSPHIQVTTDSSWSSISAWAVKDLAKAQAENSPSIERLVSEWNKEAGDSALYYATLATRFVQDQVRYMGVEMGSYSFVPHNPGQVLRQRYGDCKDKALLLCTFLRLRHIQASVAFVNTDYGTHLNEYLPSVDLFDHAIVTFTYNGNVYWIDPTINYQGGDISDIATPDYGYALVISPGMDSLTVMQVNAPGYTEIRERFYLPQEKQARGILAVKTTYTGGDADNIRQQFKMNSLIAIQKDYLSYYNRLYNHVSIMDSILLQDDTTNNIVTVREKYYIGQIWKIMDSTLGIKRFTVYAKSLEDRLPDAVGDDRKAPLALMAPVNLNYRIQLILPDKWDIQPLDKTITRPAYYYSFASSRSDDTVNLDYIYQTYRDYITPDSVKLLNADLQVMDADLTYKLTKNDSVMRNKKKVSGLSLLITFFSLIFFIWIGVKMYHYSPAKWERQYREGRPLGGWLILVGIGLCLTPLRLTYTMIANGYLSRSIWLGAEAYHEPGLIFLIAFEVMVNVFLLVYSVVILFLFFKKRNTLPAAFIFICIFNIVFLLVDHFVSKAFIASSSGISASTIRLIFYSCIWIPYFLISKRVKETFVYAYGQKAAESLPQEPYPEGSEVEQSPEQQDEPDH